MATGPAIPPRRSDERAYERALRAALLDPTRARTEAQIAQARRTYESIRDAIRRLGPEPNLDDIAELEARTAMLRVKNWHKQRFQRAMRRYFGVRVDLIADTPLDLEARIRENVRLIKTIPSRYHDSLIDGITRLQIDGPFDEAKLQKLLTDQYRSSGFNVRRITRDQTAKLVGQLNQARQTELGIEEYKWLTAGDERVRPTHVAHSGLTFRWDQPPTTTGPPGQDIQCFPAGQLVHAAGAQASVRYGYSGEIVEIRLADRVQITTSPNHPILTETGWKRAGDVHEGDQLVKHLGRGCLAASGLDPQLRDGYASAEQLHCLLGGRADERWTQPRAIDLHGHGARWDEEVEVVAAPRELRDSLKAVSREVFPDLGLESSDVAEVVLAGQRGAVTHLGFFGGVASGIVGGSGERSAFVGGERVHPDLVRFAGGAHGQAQIVEAGLDHVAADAEIGGDLADRLLGVPALSDLGVELGPAFVMTRVAGGRRRHYDGPLFSFQTATGLILANGIVTHNCRCVALAVFTPPGRRQPGGSVADA